MTTITASNTIQYSDDAWAWIPNKTYYKAKEIVMTNSYTGSWRISFDLEGEDIGTLWYGYGRIYKNGVPYGIEQTQLGYVFATKIQDFTGISINSGDLIQLYVHADTGLNVSVYIQNFRIMFDVPSSTQYMIVD